MKKELNIDHLKDNILSLKKINFHSFTLSHLANFSNLFHNLGSMDYEIEKNFGARVDIRTVGPQSFVMINTLLYEYLNVSSQHHSQILELNLPFKFYMKDELMPALYNKKCTYSSLSKAFNIPIETIRRHCKVWIDSGIMIKSKERGLCTDINLLMNSNLFKKTHFQIANSMIKSWKSIISNLNDLEFVKNKVYFNPSPLNNISKSNYIKIIINLNYFWYRALVFQKNSDLSFFELCILSSSLYFKDSKKSFYDYRKDTDFYNNILLPTNIDSISSATLIPRETTRRTVHKLIKKKLLRKESNSIFISNNVLKGDTDILINKKLKEKIVDDSMIVLKTFNDCLSF